MGKPEGKNVLEIYIGVDGRIILKWILNNSDYSYQIFRGIPLDKTNYVPNFPPLSYRLPLFIL
jgi:hypothetical protein